MFDFKQLYVNSFCYCCFPFCLLVKKLNKEWIIHETEGLKVEEDERTF